MFENLDVYLSVNLKIFLKRLNAAVGFQYLKIQKDYHSIHNFFLLESATPSQSLLIIRCCGSLLPDELPENRTKLVQKIWTTLNNLSKLDLSIIIQQ